MKKINSVISITLLLLFLVISCSEKDDPIIDNNDKNKNENKYVNDWIFEEMNIYYLWNEKIPHNPDFKLSPDDFFESLLYHYDAETNPEGDRFSWIQEDYADLLGSLSGVQSDEIGFEYAFAYFNNKLFAVVSYPKKGTDAYAKGIRRGRVITAVDGKEITEGNYRTIFSGVGSKTLTMADFIYNEDIEDYELTITEDVSVRMEKNFAESPVYMDSVYTEPITGKKVGYMVYNFFAADKGNDNSHSYDKLLMNRLSEIKEKGATEMILDLRYNGGGNVSTAIALASALVKDRSTDKVLVTSEYNSLLNAIYKDRYGADSFKDFFIDKIFKQTVDSKGNTSLQFISDIPELNLPRLYVLVTRASASASEFVINGLKPYMDVILIGETTYGKNVGSFSLYEEDDSKNRWGMQPIVVKFYNSNGESDFTAGFDPDIEIDEFKYLPLSDFGNTDDPLLSAALNHIAGANIQTRSMMRKEIKKELNFKKVKNSHSIFKDKSRFEMYDDVRGEKIKQLMENR